MSGETSILATKRTELFSNKPMAAIILKKQRKTKNEKMTNKKRNTTNGHFESLGNSVIID